MIQGLENLYLYIYIFCVISNSKNHNERTLFAYSFKKREPLYAYSKIISLSSILPYTRFIHDMVPNLILFDCI